MSRFLALTLLSRPISHLHCHIRPMSTAVRTETFTHIISTHSSTYPGQDLSHDTNSDADDFPASTPSSSSAIQLPEPEYEVSEVIARPGERWVEQLATMSEAFVKADREKNMQTVEELQRETVRREMEEGERRRHGKERVKV